LKKLPGRAAGLAALIGLACACGSEIERETHARSRLPRVLSAEFPVRLTAGDEELVFSAPPARVLPLNAAWLDFTSLLVGPDRLAAIPAGVLGYSRLAAAPGAWAERPSFSGLEAERLLSFQPDLVLAHTWQNPETLAVLRGAGVPVLALPVPESWAEIAETLQLLACVLGEKARGEELLRDFERRGAELLRRAQPFAGQRALSYTNLGAGGWVSGARTTADVLLGLCGLRNAAAEAGLEGDVPADAERLLALAPDLFVVGRPDRTESSAPSAEFLLAEPALTDLPALRERRLLTLPPALFTTASPELLRGAEVLVEELEQLARSKPLPAKR